MARHSFATVLNGAGVSTSLISESLGHSSEKVTQFYLDSFEYKQFNEAMKYLLRFPVYINIDQLSILELYYVMSNIENVLNNVNWCKHLKFC